LSSEQTPATPAGGGTETLGKVVGLLVFLAGIAMIILVFTWVREVFDGIDQQVHSAHQAHVASLAAQEEEQEQEGQPAGGSGESGASEVVTARPGAGPTIAEVAATITLKMLGLLILGWLGALVAAKGAHLAAAYRGKSG